MLKVLLVDDEPFIIQGLKVIIDWENEEFEIAGTASNGKEALQFLENENVDLVIADIRMPEMTGLELLETLRKDKKSDVYFVILSGYADFSYAQQAMQNDCTDYILKPVDKEMLLKVLNKVLVLKNEKNQINEDNKKMKHEKIMTKSDGKKVKWEIKNNRVRVYLPQNLKTEVNALAFSFTRQAIQ